MLYLLSFVIAVLVIVIIVQYLKLRHYAVDLKDLARKITVKNNNKSEEKMMVFTSSHELQELLQTINSMIEKYHLTEVENIRYKEAMRKMMANISHDLKTPLTVVNGYVESILLTPDMSNEEKSRLLKKVNMKSNELIKLINDFFDLAKIESGDFSIPLTKVNVNEVVRTTLLTYYEAISSKGLEVKLSIPNTDYFVHGNAEMLIRVLENLISNAMNYGSDGGVIGIDVYLKNLKINVDVWDKGKGISEKYHSNVFERLYTLEDSRNKNYQGSGLGLTITKRLIEKMNGTIKLSSSPNERTDFIITFDQLTL